MDYRYKAFISYRHNDRDTAVAKAIQQGLERFHIPASIREKYGTERIGRVFRDQEELEITSDLSKKIMDALDDSEYLVIICSPHYTESRWCLLEAETFIRTHDRDHVLCVLSEGEPPAVFPEILLQDGAEPLACDWRMDFRDANRMELPRLASAMIGCTYDELILRQEKYRRRRLISALTAI
ncbi:MAG: toll/interleukin-1 receptor domain-containing protein, partial [Solobacterium sp.]|nr:toll/interleukin-1 receptor domain-containing protein [Solobacterium sp.]